MTQQVISAWKAAPQAGDTGAAPLTAADVSGMTSHAQVLHAAQRGAPAEQHGAPAEQHGAHAEQHAPACVSLSQLPSQVLAEWVFPHLSPWSVAHVRQSCRELRAAVDTRLPGTLIGSLEVGTSQAVSTNLKPLQHLLQAGGPRIRRLDLSISQSVSAQEGVVADAAQMLQAVAQAGSRCALQALCIRMGGGVTLGEDALAAICSLGGQQLQHLSISAADTAAGDAASWGVALSCLPASLNSLHLHLNISTGHGLLEGLASGSAQHLSGTLQDFRLACVEVDAEVLMPLLVGPPAAPKPSALPSPSSPPQPQPHAAREGPSSASSLTATTAPLMATTAPHGGMAAAVPRDGALQHLALPPRTLNAWRLLSACPSVTTLSIDIPHGHTVPELVSLFPRLRSLQISSLSEIGPASAPLIAAALNRVPHLALPLETLTDLFYFLLEDACLSHVQQLELIEGPPKPGPAKQMFMEALSLVLPMLTPTCAVIFSCRTAAPGASNAQLPSILADHLTLDVERSDPATATSLIPSLTAAARQARHGGLHIRLPAEGGRGCVLERVLSPGPELCAMIARVDDKLSRRARTALLDLLRSFKSLVLTPPLCAVLEAHRPKAAAAASPPPVQATGGSGGRLGLVLSTLRAGGMVLNRLSRAVGSIGGILGGGSGVPWLQAATNQIQMLVVPSASGELLQLLVDLVHLEYFFTLSTLVVLDVTNVGDAFFVADGFLALVAAITAARGRRDPLRLQFLLTPDQITGQGVSVQQSEGRVRDVVEYVRQRVPEPDTVQLIR